MVTHNDDSLFKEQLCDRLQGVLDAEQINGTIHIALFLLDLRVEPARTIATTWTDVSDLEIPVALPVLHSAVPRELGQDAVATHLPQLGSAFDAVFENGDVPLVIIMGSSPARVLPFSVFQCQMRQ